MVRSSALPIGYQTGRPAVAALGVIGLALWACAREDFTAPCTSVVGGQTALDSALSVHRRHTHQLMEVAGVVGTGVGLTADCRPAIRISVKEAGVAGLPASLEGIPVVVRVTGEIRALGG